jgi:DNA-binding NarL/FixJ family response regulator
VLGCVVVGFCGGKEEAVESKPAHGAVVFDADPVWLGTWERTLARLGIEVVAAASGAVRALALVEQQQPDLFLFDPGSTGGRACLRVARERAPAVTMVAVSFADDYDLIGSVFAAGASAYVVKQASGGDVVAGLRGVLKQLGLSPRLRLVGAARGWT